MPATHWKEYGIAPKPTGRGESGYVDETGVHSASMEEIAERLDSGRFDGKVAVWTPDTFALVTAPEVPYFQEAYRTGLRRRATSRRLRLGYAFTTVIGIGLLVLSIAAPDRPDVGRLRSAAALIIALGLFSEIAPRITDLRDSRRTGAELADLESANARHQAWVASRPTRYSWAIVVGLGVIFVCQLLAGVQASIVAAGFSVSAVKAGMWWRLFTAPLLHAAFWHIIGNASVIAAAAERIETHLDRAYVPLVFLVSALYGGLASMLFMTGNHPSIGASAGAMGLIGFLLVFARRHRAHLATTFSAPMKMALFFAIAIGIVGYEVIGGAAHIGGLVAGILLGLLLIRERPRGAPFEAPGRSVMVASGISLAVLAVSAIAAVGAMFGLAR